MKRLEFGERFDGLPGSREHAKNIKTDLQCRDSSVSCNHWWIAYCGHGFKLRHLYLDTHRFAQRSALPNRDLVTILHTESWGNVRGQVFVSLLVPRVFGYEVKVFPTDDKSSVHFCGDNGASEDSTADGYFTSKRAFLVYQTQRFQHLILSMRRPSTRLHSRV